MANYAEIVEATESWIRKQVFKTPISGAGMQKFKHYRIKSKKPMIQAGGAERNFEVYDSPEPVETFMYHINSTDEFTTINIVICYENKRRNRAQAKKDFINIRQQINTADNSELTALGLNCFSFTDFQFLPGEGDNDNEEYIYMVIPVHVLLTATH